MVQLSLLEEIKDKANRLIPTAYMEIVEECTAPHLLIPTYEHVRFLCETVNRKPDTIGDVVRALRRRLADNDVAVKHLTIQLLESMMKNTSTSFHIEIASQKGLLRELVNTACMQPTTGRAMQAKEAALLLTLNLSIWFRGHPAEECYILTTLADDVRNLLGPNCFEGIEPERNTRVKVQMSVPSARTAAPQQRQQPYHAGGARPASSRAAGQPRREKRNVVDAIPIDLPTPERVSAMLDVCVTFSEYLNNAAMTAETPLLQDEVVLSYRSQVQADHEYVTILLSSNLQVDRDILRTVSDSQRAILDKVVQMAKHGSRGSRTPQATMPVPAASQTPVRSAGDTERTGASISPSRASPPRAEVDGVDLPAIPVAPVATAAAPTVDDLFGSAEVSVNPSHASASEVVPVDLSAMYTAAPPAEAAREAPIAVRKEEEKEEKQPAPVEEEATETVSPPPPAAPEQAEVPLAEEVAVIPEVEEAAPVPEDASPAAAGVEEKKPEPKDDDDFDAFLEGHMGS